MPHQSIRSERKQSQRLGIVLPPGVKGISEAFRGSRRFLRARKLEGAPTFVRQTVSRDRLRKTVKQPVERRLAAILAVDMAGYSRLMGADEEGALLALKGHRRQLFDPKIKQHRGRIV